MPNKKLITIKSHLMNKKILLILGLVWSFSGFSQTNTPLTDGYQPPQTVINQTVQMLPGFHADSRNVIYNNGGEFIARSDNNVTGGPVITNPPVVHNPSLGENYIYTRTYLAPVTSSNNYAPQVQSITYFDGLGRPKQNIAIKSSTTGKDLVTPIVYDNFGRQTRDYLPIPQGGTQNGDVYPQNSSMVDFPVSNSAGVYPAGEKIFSEKILENSPLDRIKEQFGSGSDWKSQNKRVVLDYQTNGGNDVLKFVTNTSWSGEATKSVLSLAPEIYYTQATLYKNMVTDEDDNVSYEFKNGQGQTLLVKKVLTSTESADTYYVYNEYDQLAFVISPKASEKIRTQQVSANLSETGEILKELSYQYRYDGRNRLVEKKLPGKGLDPDTGIWHWELMVYDNQDRLVMTQDPKLHKEGQWAFTKYDQFGRAAYTGLTADSGTRQSLQAVLNGKGSNNVARTGNASGFTAPGLIVYYDNIAANNYPNTITKLLSVNYYDTYPKDKPDLSTLGFTQTFITDDAQSNAISTKSLPVASYLSNIEANSWTKTFSYYDDKGRAIATYSKNYLGGHTQTESILDFTGVPQKTITKHRRRSTDADVTIQERFVYDHQNRLKEHYHQIDSKPEVLLTENTYDELGRLNKKKVGNNLQEINYAYNIRGWITGINDFSNLSNDLFAYKINYNILDITNTKPYLADQSFEIKPKFNGNISQIDWIKVDPSAAAEPVKSYGYSYDKLNRLRAGFYYVKSGNDYSFTEENNEILKYDLNGNIDNLKRFSYKVGTVPSKIDDLDYSYVGNKLTSIDDASLDGNGYEGGGSTIDYDINGNMINMLDKGINSIAYNHLNLPNAMDMGAGKRKSSNSNIYRADGVKLKKVYTSQGPGISNTWVTTVSTTDYLDGFQYLQKTPSGNGLTGEGLDTDNELELAMEREAFQKEATVDPLVDPGGGTTAENFVLQFVPTAEGYYSFTENRYIYQYKDHLGNARVSFARNNTSGAIEVTDKNDYYPFGMNHLYSEAGAYFGQGSYKNYKFGGKELQETGAYDFGARQYLPDIGRWISPDLLSEEYSNWTPYRYSFNNPINVTDPTGLLEDWYNDSDGNVSWHDSQEDQITGSNGETLNRLGKSGEYLNANGGVTTLNKDATVTQNGSTSLMNLPSQMSPAAMGGDVISGQGTPTVFASFDTTKYGTPGPFPLQSPALMDPSAAMFKFYAEGQAGGYLFRGLGRILSYEAPTITTTTLSGRLGNAATRSQIDDIAGTLEGRGYTVTRGGGKFPEEYLKPIGGGRKGGSYLDLTATHPEYPTLRINTVDVYKSGLPTARELNNATRIRSQIPAGEHLLLIPKR
jgi:RHS repeat-associated protein